MAENRDIYDFTLSDEEMKRIDADWRLHAYPRVMHAFTNPNANDPEFGTVYHEQTAKRSWREMLEFFAEVMPPK